MVHLTNWVLTTAAFLAIYPDKAGDNSPTSRSAHHVHEVEQWMSAAQEVEVLEKVHWLPERGLGCVLTEIWDHRYDAWTCLGPLLPVLGCVIVDSYWREGSGIPIVLTCVIICK